MIGPYKRSKFAAEAVVRELVAERGLPAVIVNPSTPVGPRDVKPTPTGRILVEAACGRIPGYVDTGLNLVHVDDVAAGHLLAAEKGEVGERYILGGENMTLAEILAAVAALVGRRPPRFRVPHAVALCAAGVAELAARVTGREPFATVDGARMARKKMYFSSMKAIGTLGYAPRPARQGIVDAVSWFEANGYLR
jgi:dihydroflavonol-4-reductase